MSVHIDLMNEIRARKAVSEFNQGILPADLYVKSMEQMCGTDICYKYASKNQVSFADAMKTASRKLTYNNADMVVEEVYSDFKSKIGEFSPNTDIELPKNTLMVFRHILTTPRKDRDGDVMRTQGAKPDPKMLLLWQHVHTLPIGKLLAVHKHNNKVLEVISAIVDMNDLSHDSAVMVDNGMGRFSHGFKALEFTKIKSIEQMDELEELLGVKFSEAEREKAKDGKAAGFDVSEFEIMEESLVSVPSNVDSETQEVYLSLIEGKQLRSGLMKSFGETIRAGMPKKIPVNIDFNVSINGKAIGGSVSNLAEQTKGDAEDEMGTKGCGCGKPKGECDCQGGSSTPKQEGKSETGRKEEQVDAEDKKMMCPECGGKVENGVCKKCGYKMDRKKEDKEEKSIGDLFDALNEEEKDEFFEDLQLTKFWEGKYPEISGEKAGRVLSKSNYEKLVSVKEDLYEMHKSQLVTTRSGMALCEKCMKNLSDVIDSAKTGMDMEPDKDVELTMKEAMSFFLSASSKEERLRMKSSLDALEQIERREGKKNTLKKLLSIGRG